MTRISLFGIEIDSVRMEEAVHRLQQWIEQPSGHCRYVVTPNVDHAVMLQSNPTFLSAYRDADLVVADGHPIVMASRLLGRPLPERVPGSDLVPQLLASATHQRPFKVFLLGAAPGVADRAAAQVTRRWPGVHLVGTYSPPLGFQHDPVENEEILRRIASVSPDILVVGLGAPKQELWVHQHQHELQASVALCVGATIDFLAGEKARAPRWMQRARLEWLHRMASEPRRMIPRYAKDAWVFPQIVWRHWWSGA